MTVPAFRMGGIYYRHGESGASFQDAASVKLMLRQPGMETRCTKGRAETAQLARCEA
nr:hypothetical protein [Citrobacter freundii]